MSQGEDPRESPDGGPIPGVDRVVEPVEDPQAEPAPVPAVGDPEEGAAVDGALPAAEAPVHADPVVEALEPEPAAAPAAEEAPLPPPPDAADMPPRELRAVIESLLLVATKPLTPERLAGCIPGVSALYLAGFLAGLAARFDHEGRGWELLRIANGWQLLTRRAHHPWVRQLERKELPARLTRGAIETLAIVAYKQPIARGAIEDIRGVQCGPVLRQLMDLRLVAVVGREEHALGRPLLYGTTDSFLNRFGLGSLADLPQKHEFGV